MESKFRRSNLKFFCIPETNKETWTDTENIIKHTLLNDLKLSRETIDHMRIERAYRLNPQINVINATPRPIIVNFAFSKDRDLVWENRLNLKKSKIWIAEDCPPEIEEKRKLFYPILRAALSFKSKKVHDIKQVSFNKDRLILNYKSYSSTEIDKLPNFLKPENIAKKESQNVVAFYSNG